MQIFKTLLTASFLISSLAAAKDIQRVDVQVNFRTDEKTVRSALDLRNKDVEEREVYLFENKKLAMYSHNIQIRLRIEADRIELGVKRWNLTEDEFNRFDQQFNGRCEKDIHGKDVIRACVIKQYIDLKKAKKLTAGEVDLFSVLNREQLALLIDGSLPASKILRSLRALGPIHSRAWKWKKNDRKFSLDVQTIAGVKLPFMELSVKAENTDPTELFRETVDDLEARGLDIPANQSGRRLEKLRALLNCDRLLSN